MILPGLLIAACIGVTPDSDRILAGDLAQALPVFGELAPDTPIAFAPVAGSRRIFHASELRMLALKQGLPPDSAREDVCVERKSVPLSPADLLAAMKRALPEASIELLDFSRQPVPLGRLEFALRDLRQTAAGAFWRGAVRYAGGRSVLIWTKVRVAVRQVRVSAAEPLRARQALQPADLRIEEVEAFPQPGRFVSTIEEASGRVLRRAVEKGSALESAWLEPASDVMRGEPVLVEARAGATRLEFEGIAEATGATGQMVAIKNPESKKKFFARIQGKGRVVVDGGTK